MIQDIGSIHQGTMDLVCTQLLWESHLTRHVSSHQAFVDRCRVAVTVVAQVLLDRVVRAAMDQVAAQDPLVVMG